MEWEAVQGTEPNVHLGAAEGLRAKAVWCSENGAEPDDPSAGQVPPESGATNTCEEDNSVATPVVNGLFYFIQVVRMADANQFHCYFQECLSALEKHSLPSYLMRPC